MPDASVLVVDDSSVARRMISAELAKVAGIGAVTSVASGALALTRIQQSLPSVIVLDLEMPDMDGIETLVRIRAISPDVPVIMFSSLTERGARVTFDALAKGATDYVLKPVAAKGENLERVVHGVLAPKILSLGRPKAVAAARPTDTSVATTSAPPLARGSGVGLVPSTVIAVPQIVVIASSTGGPNALADVVPALRRAFPVPIVIVQHMPPVFTRCLAERLDAQSNVRVREASDGDCVVAGEVLIAPGGEKHLELVRDGTSIRARLVDAPPENSCRPAADVLFRSAARVYGADVLAVVMTGMGEDGLAGSREIVRAGGRVIAQSGPSCVVWGMPRAVELAGICSEIVPLSGIPGALERGVEATSRAVQFEKRALPC